MSARDRVRKFLDEREKMLSIDRDQIANLNTGTEREASLTVSDLEEILAELESFDYSDEYELDPTRPSDFELLGSEGPL